jgi:methionyl aminopeptidase
MEGAIPLLPLGRGFFAQIRMKIDNGFIVSLKDDVWLERQKQAGKAVSECLKTFAYYMNHRSLINVLEIEETCAAILKENGCTPTFYKYKPSHSDTVFPGKVCVSVNKEVVHGIPKSYDLEKGDVVTLDLGATYEGAIADAAFTCTFGKCKDDKIKKMLIDCQKSLNCGIDAVKVGDKTGAIGAAIHGYVKTTGFGLITDFGGHGLDYNELHTHPFIDNKSRKNSGIVMEPGLSIAIEPMLTITKNTRTKLLKDGWTIITNGISCHFEHSVTLDPSGNKHIISYHGMDVKDYI